MATFQLNNPNDPTEPSSYTLTSGTTCIGSQQICTIEASADSAGQPIIDTTLLKQMVRALNRHIDEPLVKLKA